MPDNLPPKIPPRPNTRPPIRWDSESDTAALFYAIKAWGKQNHPGRHWTNDSVFEFIVRVVAEMYSVRSQEPGEESEAE